MQSSWLLLLATAGLASAAAPPPTPSQIWAEHELYNVVRNVGIFWAVMAFILLAYNVYTQLDGHLRKVAGATGTNQAYFYNTSPWSTFVNRHIISAPLFSKRKAKVIGVGKRLKLAMLPTRLETFWLVAYVAINFAFLFSDIDWSLKGAELAQIVRNRCGVMSVINLVPLVLIAGRNNALIYLFGISFDTFNLFHRWVGRMVVLFALMHVLTFVVSTTRYVPGGAALIPELIKEEPLFMAGLVAIVGFAALVVHSPRPLRALLYDVFVHVHQALAILALGAVWYHLQEAEHWTKNYVVASVAIWAFERFIRLVRIGYRNFNLFGKQKLTRCDITALPGDAIKVKVRLARPWSVTPGQHAFLYVPGIVGHLCHPFSIAWAPANKSAQIAAGMTWMKSSSDVESVSSATGKDAADDKVGVVETGHSISPSPSHYPMATVEDDCVTFIIKKQGHFTSRIHRHASSNTITNALAIVEGPYWSESLSSYGTAVLVAGGIGITHQLLQIRQLLDETVRGTCATKRITLLWVVQDASHIEWIRDELLQVLDMQNRRNMLRVRIYVTRPEPGTLAQMSPSQSISVIPRRPNLKEVIAETLAPGNELSGPGAACVSVCGGGSLSDDVREATRACMDRRRVDYKEASFSW